jgi:hypothetical protein
VGKPISDGSVELWRSVHRRAPRAEISDITNTARRFRNALWIFALGALILAVVYAYRQSFRFYMPVVTLRRLIERADTDLDSSSNAEEFEILERWAQTVLHERELDQQRLSRLQPLALADLIRRTINGATLDEHERSIVDVELLPTRIVAVRIDPLVSSDHGWDRRSVDLLPMVRCWFGVGPNEIVVATNSASSESDVRTLHKDLCSRLVGCRVTTGVGPVVRDRDELATCAAKCRRLVHLRRLSRDHELVRDTDIATDLPAEPFITDSEATRLANLARLADADSLVAEIERFIGEMTGSHTCERAVKALASDLLAMVFRASQSGTDPNYEMGRLIEWNNQLDSAFTVEDILTVLRDSVEELCRPAGGRSEHEAAIEGNPR